MIRHDARVEQIRGHLRGVSFREYVRTDFHAFVMNSHRGEQLAQEFLSRNSLLKPLLEFTKADEQFGVLILNRQRCSYCCERWSAHVMPGGKCLFEATSYVEGPL